ncbi:MAG: hypothetical protein LBM99_01735 [Bacillales bacterium]|jgi:hypothetical protein|nr:hypothetical protein [Bacillales bacterium]
MGKRYYSKFAKKEVEALSMQEKGVQYARDLKEGVNGLTGEKLTPAQAGYRMGVLNERSSSAWVFKKKNPNYKRK